MIQNQIPPKWQWQFQKIIEIGMATGSSGSTDGKAWAAVSPRTKRNLMTGRAPRESLIRFEKHILKSHERMAAVTVKFRRAHLAQSGSRRRRSGRELRRRYSDMLLNNALIAGLLANGSYAAFEAQTKLRVRGDREASFVSFRSSASLLRSRRSFSRCTSTMRCGERASGWYRRS